ncbi:hypothetical protein ACTMU2_33445 [Cupriavidus basilensis]
MVAERSRAVGDSGAWYISRQTDSAVPRPDAPAQLVELRQAEALGMLDHHQRGIG